jgi:hypothetical protein
VSLGILIELDVGAGRCGLPLGDPSLVPLAERIARHDRLSFRGLRAYEGHAMHRDSREVRATLVGQAGRGGRRAGLPGILRVPTLPAGVALWGDGGVDRVAGVWAVAGPRPGPGR